MSNAAVLLFGGIETTEGMIATTIAHLLSRPGAARTRAGRTRRCCAGRSRSRCASSRRRRRSTATRPGDVSFGGASIAAGDLVLISIAAANRDPAVFERPDVFDVRRAPNRHVTFAAGPHVCIGMHLARLEAHTAVERLLGRLPGLRLAPGHEPPQVRGLVFRKPTAVDVVWEPRAASPA